MLVATFWLNGGLNQVMLWGRFFPLTLMVSVFFCSGPNFILVILLFPFSFCPFLFFFPFSLCSFPSTLHFFPPLTHPLTFAKFSPMPKLCSAQSLLFPRHIRTTLQGFALFIFLLIINHLRVGSISETWKKAASEKCHEYVKSSLCIQHYLPHRSWAQFVVGRHHSSLIPASKF